MTPAWRLGATGGSGARYMLGRASYSVIGQEVVMTAYQSGVLEMR
jgi:hypothetical protein